jgi:hypothetical protein
MTQESQSIPLIDSQDGFEVIRDKIAWILAAEGADQVAKATAAGKTDPTEWSFRVYLERDNPWEEFQGGALPSPIVNVFFDDSGPDEGTSNRSDRQKHTSRYNIDVYAYAESEETAGGHTPGDMQSAILSHRTVRLVRNILMHDKYGYLGLLGAGFIWSRWIEKITPFQPSIGNQPVEHVRAARLTLAVEHNETIDFEDPSVIEIINVKFYHEVGGQVIAELEYDHSG